MDNTINDSRFNVTESRPLSYMEKFATGWLSPIVHFTFSGPFTESLIFKSMQKVRAINPLLRCSIINRCIVTISAQDSLQTDLPITLNRTSHDGNERFNLAADCAYQRMGLNMVPQNLWHMTFFYNDDGCEMIFQVHHSLFDGMSWFTIAKDFLNACEGHFLEIKPLNFALESIYPEHAKAIQNKEPFSVKEWFEITDITPQIEPIYTGSALVHLPSDVLHHLKIRARSEGLTVHAALMAAYLFATDNQLPKLYSDVSTRRWCHPPLDPISPGVYNCQVVWPASVDKNKSFWENARLLINKMRNLISDGAHLESNSECSSTSTGPEITCITNMASSEMPKGKFKLELSTVELVTGTSSEIPSFPIIFSIMTANENCSMRLHYHQNFWSAKQAKVVLSKIVNILTNESGLKYEKLKIFLQPQNQWVL
jgi:hypothetical protein